MRPALWVLLGLVVLACGVAGGYRFGLAFSRSASTAANALALSDASRAIATARISRSSVDYEVALWRFLAVLQSEGSNKNSRFDDWVVATDTALTLARLSDMAAEQGLGEKSQFLRKWAVEQCPRMKLKNFSADAIFDMARSTTSTASE